MRVLMIAPPGAGKGTQGALIAAHFDIPHIATGELLRDHVARRTALGQAVQVYLDRASSCPTRSCSNAAGHGDGAGSADARWQEPGPSRLTARRARR
jgi:Adenylate kinase